MTSWPSFLRPLYQPLWTSATEKSGPGWTIRIRAMEVSLVVVAGELTRDVLESCEARVRDVARELDVNSRDFDLGLLAGNDEPEACFRLRAVEEDLRVRVMNAHRSGILG